jgi:phosphotransacetylase/acyl dehydratase
MSGYRNVTFDEIEVGATASARRVLTQTEIEALVLVSGDIVPFHIDDNGFSNPDEICVDAVAAEAIISGMLERRLPGPGTRIVSQQLEFEGRIRVGDEVTASVTAREKIAATGRVVFDCEVIAAGARILRGTVTVEAPRGRLSYSEIATPEIILRRNDVFARLLRRCEPLAAVTCAVAHPCDRDSLLGALEAARRNLIVPVLVGPAARIQAVAAANGVDISPYRLVDTAHSHASAATAVALARAGEVETLMKGSLHTDEIMSEVIAAQTGLRTERRISHVFVMDVPAYDRMLLVTDAAINIEPTLREKADITQNAIDLACSLGVETPKVAILSAVETVSPDIRSTIDAAALCKMADRGQITGAVLDGPLAFDNAISEFAARTKSIRSPVAGAADILLVPNIEAGNMLAKQLLYFAGADSAGIVLGARVPVVLTSRADNVRMRIGSAAVAKLLVHARRAATAAAAASLTSAPSVADSLPR